MLIIFHYFVILVYQILKNRQRLKSVDSDDSEICDDEVDLENLIKFDPPVYRQRYERVYEILIDPRWRNKICKLADFGCAEFGLFQFLKHLNLNEIVFVDIDENLLEEKMYRIQPLIGDQLKRRTSSLAISVCLGSVSDPDYRLLNTDVVTAIELIEHLYPDTLDAFSYNIFSSINPKLVIITTPNVEFNVVFNKSNIFRHPDHKYEWTRKQFEDWSENIVTRFPQYKVEFHGIGKYSNYENTVGCCSQMALFIRKDLLDEQFVPSVDLNTCLCDINSPCKDSGNDPKCLCHCVCKLCVPDFSIGICTYCTHSKLFTKTSNTTELGRRYNHRDLDSENYFMYNENSENNHEVNPSRNIFYKCIEIINYPYEIDTRSEQERLLDTLKYRIQAFSFINTRFYVEERLRCEIPVIDIMYGDIHVTEKEISTLLKESHYILEQCIIQETGLSENCIVTVPREMEEISSSSDVTEEYSAKSETTDNLKFENNIIPFIDWDDSSSVKESKTTKQDINNTEVPKSKPDPLFDSGYLNSPSPLETTAKLLQLSPQDDQEALETDKFEDLTPTPSLLSKDNKVHMKKNVQRDKLVVSPTVESNRAKIDPNRVNELDKYRYVSGSKNMNNQVRQQELKKLATKDNSVKNSLVKDPIAGPSGWKKSLNFKNKDQQNKKSPLKKDCEPTHLDDAKSITNCIIQNSLNKIEVQEESPKSELIKDLNIEQNLIQDVEALLIPENLEAVPHEVGEVAPVVENSDLANNNRDNEGNNFPAIIQDIDIDEGIDLLNDNLEDIVPLLEDNLNMQHNNNDVLLRANIEPPNIQREAPAELEIFENIDEPERPEVLAMASREALYDVNSEPDMLDDLDIPPLPNETPIFETVNFGNNVVLLGFQPLSLEDLSQNEDNGQVSVETNTNRFPPWLLQIFGSQVNPDEVSRDPLINTVDEPHFYCQGDGLGVHPSIVAVEIDETEDAEDSSEDSSSNNTADYAEVDPGPSETFDMSSLPEESSAVNSVTDDPNQQPVQPSESAILPEEESTDDITSSYHQIARKILDDITEVAKSEVEKLSYILSCTECSPESSSVILPELSAAQVSEEEETEFHSVSSVFSNQGSPKKKAKMDTSENDSPECCSNQEIESDISENSSESIKEKKSST
ncbi:uncharacterized protein LOC115884554 [Sitophilus oryzae]|uniref:Small RNA 2'-O-methyltransferase n=1 Tax=Sitophilus oryzae TaxID=7048 RepID=A0A6J2Y7T7_SITOR|nr:uncharacterized protein LOC115884554 [Sitophilus oryzae]